MVSERVVLSILVSCFLLLSGCAKDEGGKAGVPDSVLVGVLVDLHQAQARIDMQGKGAKGKRDSVLEAHDLTEKQFMKAMRYYTERPEEYMVLYDSVVERLSKPHP